MAGMFLISSHFGHLRKVLESYSEATSVARSEKDVQIRNYSILNGRDLRQRRQISVTIQTT